MVSKPQDYYNVAERSEGFIWGDKDPTGGFKTGDLVGIIYSDHEEYIFDNPEGVLVNPNGRVLLFAEIHDADRLYLQARPKEPVTTEFAFAVNAVRKLYPGTDPAMIEAVLRYCF